MADVDIISLWNKGKGSGAVGEIDVEDIVSRKSKTPLYWIKIILWIEFWINIISLPLMYFYLKDYDYTLYGVIMPVVIGVYLIYYQFLIQNIRKFDYTLDVKTGLRKLYGYLNFFFLHYKVAIWVFFPVGFVYGAYKEFNKGEINELDETTYWIVMAVTGVIFCGLIGLLFNFLINLIYGRKIKRLKRIVKELN